MHPANRKSSKTRLLVLTAATSAVLAFGAQAHEQNHIKQSGEQENMLLVGHDSLQFRGAYQPNFIDYPDGRTIAFVGLHGGQTLPGPLPNPLNGGTPEENGTMIVDITNPKHPVETFHIPASAPGGQSQMVRLCLGSELPHGQSGKVYMLRNVQGSSLAGYETWDVTDPYHPFLLAAIRGLRSTHKVFWECNTGIAYMPGSKDASWGLPLWRQSQSMVIVDWSDPYHEPNYIRTFGLPGGQPASSTSTGPVPPSLHGAISAHDHPNASGQLVSGVDVIGNRVYAAYGVGSNGVMQILDRNKLLNFNGVDPDAPSDADLRAPQVGILYMSPDQGGHTSMPVFGIKPKSLQCSSTSCPGATPQVRDIVMLTSEAGNCNSHHWTFAVDVTTENLPMVLSTGWVDPQSGEKYPRGNYCLRGQRFGTHSSEENFRNPYYGRLVFTSYFNAGVRAWDITDPQGIKQAGFYVPAAPVKHCGNGVDCMYMTNNVEVDNRGYIIIVDRIGNGMDILKLCGKAKAIGLGKKQSYSDDCRADDDDDHHDRH